MAAPTSQNEWIDRFAVEMVRLAAPVGLDDLIELARELWPYLGEQSPERLARADWDQAGVVPASPWSTYASSSGARIRDLRPSVR